ncbi:MAG TPA: molecular chaperone HtpG [Thermoanaerobaculia bacterium]|nr:molecular chaperone HtpG [Thermoanaerobaculia bacterium]
MTTETTTASTTPETFPFQAETRQLLDLMIHSLYSNKEIFLRELISNASDALDRLRFEALTRPELTEGGGELGIRLEADRERRTLTVHDNGIGMSRQEVIDNIGTIARSGTRELVRRLREAGEEANLERVIGQFGVGFYSSFMVADRVEMVTRRAGEEEATRWASAGDGTFTVEPASRAGRGTSITLHLKPADEEAGLPDFTDEWVLSRVVKRYSDFVAYPIVLPVAREREVEVETAAGEKEKKSETTVEERRLNSQQPLWTRPEAETKPEDYAELYRHLSGDWNEPLERIRVRAEGRIEYQALLFLPSQAPYDLFYVGAKAGLHLYVRRVQIMESCDDLLPHYLRFVKGVVDSPDLPLNVSREMLQHDRQIATIRKGLVKKVLDRLGEMAEKEEEKYLGFWREFGRAIKEGVAEDYDNRDKLLPLLRFASSHDPEKPTGLAAYVERMGADQKEIFYLTAESREQAEASPHLEAFEARGVEVLFFVDPVDELMVQTLSEFDGKRLKSIGKGTVELGSEEERKREKEELETREKEMKPLLDRVQKAVDAEVKWVRLSTRLTASPACLVGAEHDYSPQLEKLLMKGKGGGARQRRILELNPRHPIVEGLARRFAADAEDPAIPRYAELLLGYATLAEGTEVADPARFNASLAALMAEGLGGGGEAAAGEGEAVSSPAP